MSGIRQRLGLERPIAHVQGEASVPVAVPKSKHRRAGTRQATFDVAPDTGVLDAAASRRMLFTCERRTSDDTSQLCGVRVDCRLSTYKICDF